MADGKKWPLDKCGILGSPTVTGLIVSHQKSDVKFWLPGAQNGTTFEDQVFQEVAELRSGHWGGALIPYHLGPY